MNFLLQVGRVTGEQLLAVLGFFLVIGFVLSQLQKFTQRQYYQSIGWLGILWTAWIGTPIHEISHWLMAKLFGHHIDSVSLFKPNHASGKLGEVQHSYNPRNLYHQIGNFFIGAAPLFGGVLALVALFYWLLPNSQGILQLLAELRLREPAQALTQIWEIFWQLFSGPNLHSYRFWLFVYLSFAVASHLAPSSVDQKNMWRGFIWLALLLFVINGLLLYFNKISGLNFSLLSLPWLVSAFWYALVVSLVHALVSTIILFPFRRR